MSRSARCVVAAVTETPFLRRRLILWPASSADEYSEPESSDVFAGGGDGRLRMLEVFLGARFLKRATGAEGAEDAVSGIVSCSDSEER